MASRTRIPIDNSILVVRGHRVILAGDLAKIYGVETRVLNQAVKRHRERFPADFTFRLSRDEAVATRNFKITICDLETQEEYQVFTVCFHGARRDNGSQCAK